MAKIQLKGVDYDSNESVPKRSEEANMEDKEPGITPNPPANDEETTHEETWGEEESLTEAEPAGTKTTKEAPETAPTPMEETDTIAEEECVVESQKEGEGDVSEDEASRREGEEEKSEKEAEEEESEKEAEEEESEKKAEEEESEKETGEEEVEDEQSKKDSGEEESEKEVDEEGGGTPEKDDEGEGEEGHEEEGNEEEENAAEEDDGEEADEDLEDADDGSQPMVPEKHPPQRPLEVEVELRGPGRIHSTRSRLILLREKPRKPRSRMFYV
ncbi:cilia- and flagella-associated protein 251-like [Eutrema salsugineum]|uniref:cilia- and flagella-associated protein 251-like n=1 Tax=Eutrema salsugineum TaxID=72664 RepID=UPI000CED7959|nr:cilia- and flagella-associated protein 251-like [Eutrema salsugineum]